MHTVQCGCLWGTYFFGPLRNIPPGVEVSHTHVIGSRRRDVAQSLPSDDRFQTGAQ